MFQFTRRFALALVCATLFASLTLSVAYAHGHTTAGDYELVIGFRNEPAYQGEPNGLDLTVTDTKTGEKVNDLADTLKVEVIYGSSKRELKVRPQWGEDGAYTADVLPTEAGDYTWHIFGTIKDTLIDVSMTSGPDTFGAVQAKSLVSFPAEEPATVVLQDQAASAAQTAQTAMLVGGIGALLGLIGLVVGVLGLRARRTAAATLIERSGRAA